MAFNEAVRRRIGQPTAIAKKRADATFDARVYTVPDYIEVENYFVWRQQDAERNSVTMLAQHYASHKQLHGKKRSEQHEIIYQAGDNWAKHPASFKHGRVIRKRDGRWMVDSATPMFTAERDYIRNLIPRHWEGDEATAKKVGL
jgi:tRNA(His) 5'-end guanylyltransferase